jgi:hypothetical protein
MFEGGRVRETEPVIIIKNSRKEEDKEKMIS